MYISSAARTVDVVFTPAEVSRLFAAGEIPRGKRLSEINIIQNLKNASQLREKNAHLTPRIVYKIRDVLTRNLDTVPLSVESKNVLAELIASFDQKIKEKAHPFEQCFLLYEAFSASFPEESLLGAELFSRITAGFGYRIPADTWAGTVHWIKNRTLIWNSRYVVHLMT